MAEILVTSPNFKEGELIPLKHTGRGEDYSPELHISGISKEAKSIAIIMYDKSHPIISNFTHWVIWNIPVTSHIPERVPAGKQIKTLHGAIQGIAYGKHCYKGPKPPFRCKHRYVFAVFVLDCFLELSSNSKKKALLHAMESHILQKGSLSGLFKSY